MGLAFALGSIAWVAALADIAGRTDAEFEPLHLGGKTTWLVTVAITGFVGGLIYYATARPRLGKRTEQRL